MKQIHNSGTANADIVIATFADHTATEMAVKKLAAAGFAMKDLTKLPNEEVASHVKHVLIA